MDNRASLSLVGGIGLVAVAVAGWATGSDGIPSLAMAAFGLAAIAHVLGRLRGQPRLTVAAHVLNGAAGGLLLAAFVA